MRFKFFIIIILLLIASCSTEVSYKYTSGKYKIKTKARSKNYGSNNKYKARTRVSQVNTKKYYSLNQPNNYKIDYNNINVVKGGKFNSKLIVEEIIEEEPINQYGYDQTKGPIYYQGDAYYKIGNPYEIEGSTYYPKEYDFYEEEGVASWYGDKFHGKSTANGEIYDMHAYTAAHKTLPLPSIIKVTNIENGKSIILRVNDRGPFTKRRVVDVSKAASIKLGFNNVGTARVKVKYLKKESEELLRNLGVK